jgi:hypothetical protein
LRGLVDDDYLDHRGAYVRQWDVTRIISKTEPLDYMFSHGFYCVWGKRGRWQCLQLQEMATRKAANLARAYCLVRGRFCE